MIKYQIILLVGFLWISSHSASNSDNRANLLPRSITELKKYYEVVENFEQRGILTEKQASQEEQLYIEIASKLSSKDRLLTTEEFLNYEKQLSIISFSNIIAVLAGLVVFIAGLVYVSCYIKPNLTEISIETWEKLFYYSAFALMFLNKHSWLIFLGCLIFFAALKMSYYSDRFGQQTDHKFIMSLILSVNWSIVAIYQQNHEVGYLAIAALNMLSSRVIQNGNLTASLGFDNHTLVPSVTISSFFLIMLGTLLHLISVNFLTNLFIRPLLMIGTSGYFFGLFILSSRFYYETDQHQNRLYLSQAFTFVNGLGSILFASTYDLPFLQNRLNILIGKQYSQQF